MTPEVRDCQSSSLTIITIPTNTIVVSLWYFISYSNEESRGPQKGKPWAKHPSPREILLIIIGSYLTRSINPADCLVCLCFKENCYSNRWAIIVTVLITFKVKTIQRGIYWSIQQKSASLRLTALLLVELLLT